MQQHDIIESSIPRQQTGQQLPSGSLRLLLRPQEVAEALSLGVSTVYAMCASGELRAVRRGRSVRVSVEEVQRWIREQEQQEIAIK